MTNWEKLFGTPERAARTLERNCDEFNCFACPALKVNCYGGNYDALLRWLESEVCDD